MKNIKLALFFLFLNFSIGNAQEFVSKDPQLRNVVLEEFTGIHCGNCPGGHKTAAELAEKYPGRVVLFSIHEGSYANPGLNEPDFRTKWGAAILNQTNLTGFPGATINRLKFPGEPNSYPYSPQTKGGMAMSVNGWIHAAEDSLLNGTYSPVNMAVKTNWNNDTRVLEIEVEVYFTEGTSEGAKLNIALLESHIWGPQTGASDPKKYEHNHVLRDMLTGQWGEVINNTSKGSFFTKTFNYSVDSRYEITNCDISLFITKSNNREIYTGIAKSIIEPNLLVYNILEKRIYTKSNSINPISYLLVNKLQEKGTYQVTIEKSERTPQNWTASFQNGSSEISLLGNESLPVVLNVTIGKSKGIGDFTLKFLELNNPIAKPIFEKVTLLTTDINYLEIDGGGNNLQDAQKARTDFVSFPHTTFYEAVNKLNELKVIFWNFGARGRLDKNDANLIDSMSKSGIQILINGSGALPTLVNEDPTNNFFSTFGINWSPSNQIEIVDFGLKGVEKDPITNGFVAEGLSVANNGYLMQSTTITKPEIAFPMINMKENNKNISIRIDKKTSRAIYLGFNLNVLTNQNQREDLVRKSIDWLEGITSIQTQSLEKCNLQVRYLDFGKFLLVNNSNTTLNNTEISLFNLIGHKLVDIFTGDLLIGENLINYNISSLNSEYYFIYIRNNKYNKSYPLIINK